MLEHLHVGDPCVICALYDIFTSMSMVSTDMEREEVAPTSLRIALSKLYPDNNFFQEVTLHNHFSIHTFLLGSYYSYFFYCIYINCLKT